MENVGNVFVLNLNNEYIPDAKYEVNSPDYGTISVHATKAEAIAECVRMKACGEIEGYTVDAE